MDENYSKWVERQNHGVNEWLGKGHPIKEIEHYRIDVKLYADDRLIFRVRGHLIWFFSEPDMTLQELEQCIVNDIPYIKSVEFVTYSCSPIII